MLKFQFEKHQIADKYQLPCEIKSGLVEVIGITSIKYVFTTFFRLIFELLSCLYHLVFFKLKRMERFASKQFAVYRSTFQLGYTFGCKCSHVISSKLL